MVCLMPWTVWPPTLRYSGLCPSLCLTSCGVYRTCRVGLCAGDRHAPPLQLIGWRSCLLAPSNSQRRAPQSYRVRYAELDCQTGFRCSVRIAQHFHCPHACHVRTRVRARARARVRARVHKIAALIRAVIYNSKPLRPRPSRVCAQCGESE